MPDIAKRRAAAERSRKRKAEPFESFCDGCGKSIKGPGNYRPKACWECLRKMNRGVSLPADDEQRDAPGAA